MVTTLYILLGMTSFMGQEVVANVVNVFPSRAECEQGMVAEKLHTADLVRCGLLGGRRLAEQSRKAVSLMRSFGHEPVR